MTLTCREPAMKSIPNLIPKSNFFVIHFFIVICFIPAAHALYSLETLQSNRDRPNGSRVSLFGGTLTVLGVQRCGFHGCSFTLMYFHSTECLGFKSNQWTPGIGNAPVNVFFQCFFQVLFKTVGA
uniref:Uncharacterized protein n=1 Tax=Anguilla anguilla TaxID=7936 RepID=A0A0E9X1X0_ANGAN